MTKKEIAATVAKATGLTDGKAKEVIQATIDVIKSEMAHERRIELRGFGVFDVVTRGPRAGRNPHTGEKLAVPAKKVVTFKVSKELNAALGLESETAQ